MILRLHHPKVLMPVCLFFLLPLSVLLIFYRSVKRRFIRQNREIARVNSTQSQRIRNLETEISRLVADNISLREAAITAQAEAEIWRATSSINREVSDLKDRLQRKMEEMSELVVEMGRIPERASRKGRRKSRIVSAMSANTEQEWRHRLSMREAYAEERGDLQDGRLPAIHEDKLFPRRTLENAELTALREEAALQLASESPELGPPPVAHFDVPESVGLDSARTSEDENGGDDVLQLPLTLERRRKRRTSALLQNMGTEELADQPTEQPTEQPSERSQAPPRPSQQLLKSGAKRKLSVSELEEPILQQPLSENDDFVFQRRQEIWNSTTSGQKKASRFIRAPGRENVVTSETDGHSSPQKPTATRKILAPKSTNSPTKRRIHVAEKLNDDRDEQPKQAVVKLSQRNNPPPQIDVEKPVQPPEGRPGDKELLPKTPALRSDGVLSPTSTEPSTRAALQPKEAAVLNSVEDVLNGSLGRGSRRPRAAVSYAEPSLRDKMRRPGKELVGAVEGLDKNKENGVRGASMDRANSDDVKTSEDQCQAIRIKQENDVEQWKELPMRKKEEPTSPLRDKERKERATVDPKRTAHTHKHDTADDLEQAVDRLSIFDPPVSSPLNDSEDGGLQKIEHKQPSASSSTAKRKPSSSNLAGTRRHSVQPSSSLLSANSASVADPLIVNNLPSTSRSSIARAPLPRPSSAASSRSERMATIAKEIKRSRSVAPNSKAEEPASSGADPAGGASSRAERTLNRRRSMMV